MQLELKQRSANKNNTDEQLEFLKAKENKISEMMEIVNHSIAQKQKDLEE